MQDKLATALRACELIVAVKHCMMFHHVHDIVSVQEVLDKYGASDPQELAHQAQEIAVLALAMSDVSD